MHPKSERGAMVIMVAVCLLALTLFSALVLDYGVIWASRGQAQNAADAGALAAAISLMNNPVGIPEAENAARKLANANAVWGEHPLTPEILVQLPILCPPGTGGGVGCVRVQVNRGTRDLNGVTHANVLPTFFANLAGIDSQAISAVAMAQVTSGNAVSCLKPWILPDKWSDEDESGGGWNIMNTFLKPPDHYTAPGFKYPDDQGTELLLKGDANEWSAGWVQKITFGNSNSASDYAEAIHGCPDFVPTVKIWDGSVPCDDVGDENPEEGCVKVSPGVSEGPTRDSVNDLVALDSGATWHFGDNPSTPDVENGYVDSPCMDAGTCRDFEGNPVETSARIVPVALFNPEAYWDIVHGVGCSGGNCVAQVSNLFGFFLEGMCFDFYPNAATRPAFCGTTAESKKTVVGRMMQYPGQYTGGVTTSSFAQAVRLVR